MPIVQNEANFARRDGPEGRGAGVDESCETNPIRTKRQEGQVLCGKRVMLKRTSEQRRRNKANLPGATGKTIAKAGGLDAATRNKGRCVKQSQLEEEFQVGSVKC